MEDGNTLSEYPKEFFAETPPPNHNPLIGALQKDTLCNARDALCAIRELTEISDFSLTEYSSTGIYFLMTCIVNALSFEINNRK